jgi:hypothetical protein
MQSFHTPLIALTTVAAVAVILTPMLPDAIPQRQTTQADTMLVAMLSGSENVGRAGPPAAMGHATINLRPMSSEVCYNVVIKGITGNAVHIHKAPKGQNGPVSVPFTAPKDTITTGCAKVDATTMTDIGSNPTMFYVNVHTTEFPQGAIRGQLGKPLGRGGH